MKRYLLIACLTACLAGLTNTAAAENDKSVLGTWDITAIVGNPPPIPMRYAFKDEGVVEFQQFSSPDSPLILAGTYTAVDGKLEIKLAGADKAMNLTYTIDGKKMTIKGTGDDAKMTLSLKKMEEEK